VGGLKDIDKRGESWGEEKESKRKKHGANTSGITSAAQ
jgi:hypothetical protein